MAKWFLISYTDCKDPSREDDFNEWYDKIHLPDALKFPELVSATRYANIDPEVTSNKFLAIHELETDDINKTMAALKEYASRLEEQGRYTDLLNRGPTAVYKQISSLSKSESC